jgi:hypothetical protein
LLIRNNSNKDNRSIQMPKKKIDDELEDEEEEELEKESGKSI